MPNIRHQFLIIAPKIQWFTMRSFTPFGDPWQMPIALPYSLLVKDGELAWTCGQVAIDKASRVLAPDDLVGQTEIVCDYIESILGHSGIGPDALGKLVLYFVERRPGDAERMMGCCQARFGDRPVLVPIAVPHFYFDGLMLEVDAFVGSPGGRSIERSSGQAKAKVTDGGDIAWAALMVDPAKLAEGGALLQSALAEFGLNAGQRLSEHWIAPAAREGRPRLSTIAEALGRMNLLSDEGAVVESTDPDALLVGEITYVKGLTSPVIALSKEVRGVKITTRRSGRFSWFAARSFDGSLGLVPQTSSMMTALAETLNDQGLDFAAVVKSTSHYVGDSSADELFDNMTIRNGYYPKPGPASTGLPVAGFADANSRIAVDFLALRSL